MDLKDKIRSIEDYPRKGVIFRDITTLLKDAEGLKDAVDAITASLADVSLIGAEPPNPGGLVSGCLWRIIWGRALFLSERRESCLRKPSARGFELEYGKATIEIHKDHRARTEGCHCR